MQINRNVLGSAIFEALKETKPGFYLRPYARRVASLAVDKYIIKMEKRK